MDIKIPDNLHLQVRKIQNIEVWRSDLIPLTKDGVKIHSVAMLTVQHCRKVQELVPCRN